MKLQLNKCELQQNPLKVFLEKFNGFALFSKRISQKYKPGNYIFF
jgi:hypothetical protein